MVGKVFDNGAGLRHLERLRLGRVLDSQLRRLPERMDLPHFRWCKSIGGSLVYRDIEMDFTFLEEPDKSLSARPLKPRYPNKEPAAIDEINYTGWDPAPRIPVFLRLIVNEETFSECLWFPHVVTIDEERRGPYQGREGRVPPGGCMELLHLRPVGGIGRRIAWPDKIETLWHSVAGAGRAEYEQVRHATF